MKKKKKHNDVTTEIVVGAFMFSILVILLTVTIVISQNKFFERTYSMTAVFPNVGGLKEGEPVFVRGVRVGNVERIEMDDTPGGVLVSLRLRRELKLHADYTIFVEPSSMLGGMRLVIDEGSRELPVVPPDDHQQLVGSPTRDLFGEATRTVEEIRQILIDEGILSNIGRLSENLADISDQIKKGEGTIGRLVQDDKLYEEALAMVSDLTGAAKDARGITDDIRTVTTRIAAGEGTMGRLLSEDDQLYEDLSKTLASVRDVTERLAAGEGTIGRLLSGDDEVYEDLRGIMANLRQFSASLAEQQGTIARLIQEDTLYIKVESLVDEARATIDDFRETSPITTFSSIFFGAF